jgi:hypothetical protein
VVGGLLLLITTILKVHGELRGAARTAPRPDIL